jgi:hypothetical protein
MQSYESVPVYHLKSLHIVDPKLQQKVVQTFIKGATVLLGSELFDTIQARQKELEQLASEFFLLPGLRRRHKRFGRNDSRGSEASTLII